MIHTQNQFLSRRLTVYAVTSCLLFLSSCAHKQQLNAQLATTQQAIAQAAAAGAPNTAPNDYQAAREKLERANRSAQQQDNVAAMRLAQQSQADANLAQAKTHSANAVMAATEIVKSNQALRDEIGRAGPAAERKP